MFISSLVYSSDNGSITASMLVDMLQTWLLTSDNISTTVDDSLVQFSRTCPTRLTLQTTGTCTRPLSPGVECEHPTATHVSGTGVTQPTATHISGTGVTQPTVTHTSDTGVTQPTVTHAFGVVAIASTAGAFGGGLLVGIVIFGAVIGVGLW